MSYLDLDLDHVSFAEWLVTLDKRARQTGFMGEPIGQQGGILEWYPYYCDGCDQDEALRLALTEDDSGLFDAYPEE
jgi:hypothetical protein